MQVFRELYQHHNIARVSLSRVDVIQVIVLVLITRSNSLREDPVFAALVSQPEIRLLTQATVVIYSLNKKVKGVRKDIIIFICGRFTAERKRSKTV